MLPRNKDFCAGIESSGLVLALKAPAACADDAFLAFTSNVLAVKLLI